MFADNPRLSRIMAVTLLLAVIAALWSALVAPVLNLRHRAGIEIEQATRLIQSFELRRRITAGLTQELAALRKNPAAGGTYFAARSATLAAAQLQSRVKTITEAAGSRLTITQILPAVAGKDGLQRIAVRASMSGSMEAVRTVFHTLESSRPFLFIDDVSITTPPLTGGGRPVVASGEDVGVLTVRYTVYGYLWSRPTP